MRVLILPCILVLLAGCDPDVGAKDVGAHAAPGATAVKHLTLQKTAEETVALPPVVADEEASDEIEGEDGGKQPSTASTSGDTAE